MMFFRVTPVPIPNTTVKPLEADGTARETVWESRWSLGKIKLELKFKLFYFVIYIIST